MFDSVTTISVPGLGIDPFEVHSVAFSIFGLDIAWYALIIVAGMVAAVAYLSFRASGIGIQLDDILDAVIFVIPIGIIGARLYYVLFNLDSYSSLGEALNIRNGGLAIYGGIIAGTLTVIVWCRVKKINFLAFADCVAPGLILAQAIGRWGNFMNGEAYGAQTDIFCRMGLGYDAQHLDFVHPTFLYESLWNLVGFTLINIFYHKKKYDGQHFLAVFGWYGLGRMMIEGLRQDSLYIGPFRVSQLLAGAIFIVCLTLLIWFAIKPPKKLCTDEFFYYNSRYTREKKEEAKRLRKEKAAERKAGKNTTYKNNKKRK